MSALLQKVSLFTLLVVILFSACNTEITENTTAGPSLAQPNSENDYNSSSNIPNAPNSKNKFAGEYFVRNEEHSGDFLDDDLIEAPFLHNDIILLFNATLKSEIPQYETLIIETRKDNIYKIFDI